jgi:hypothetical protein
MLATPLSRRMPLALCLQRSRVPSIQSADLFALIVAIATSNVKFTDTALAGAGRGWRARGGASGCGLRWRRPPGVRENAPPLYAALDGIRVAEVGHVAPRAVEPDDAILEIRFRASVGVDELVGQRQPQMGGDAPWPTPPRISPSSACPSPRRELRRWPGQGSGPWAWPSERYASAVPPSGTGAGRGRSPRSAPAQWSRPARAPSRPGPAEPPWPAPGPSPAPGSLAGSGCPPCGPATRPTGGVAPADGICQVSRSISSSSGMSTRRLRRPCSCRAPRIPTPATSVAPRRSVSRPTSTLGNSVTAPRIAESMTSTPTMIPATAFSQPELAHGPSTARSLASSSRNTVARGSRMPARAWTPRVTSPRGRVGDQDDPGGQRDHA